MAESPQSASASSMDGIVGDTLATGSGFAAAASSSDTSVFHSLASIEQGELAMTAATAELWDRLFAAGGLACCLQSTEARRCQGVCRDWRRLACDTVTPEELWRHDLGSERRSAAWKQLLLGGITLRAPTPQDCYETLRDTPCAYDSVIKRDVGRTLPQEELFREKNGAGQRALFRLLRALAARLWDIGYCQSLNFIVATLIGVFPDDEAAAFHCTLALLLRHSLVDLYRPKFAKLGVVIWQFDRIVEGFLPKVHAVLKSHGVNAEFYAIQWFLTLFASDLQQSVVRRVWDRFLVAGWRVVVQVALALLYSVQDHLPTLDTCNALAYLRKFARSNTYQADELLYVASTFEVSHQMLSALEAAYDWEADVQLLVVKDLNKGKVHWSVQEVPAPIAATPSRTADAGEGEEAAEPMPRAFNRLSGSAASAGAAPTPPELSAETVGTGDDQPKGTVLPFLLHNLDTGETTVMERAWGQYVREMGKPPQAQVGANAATARAAVPNGAKATQSARRNRREPSGGGGSFWMQSVQKQAARRLSQV